MRGAAQPPSCMRHAYACFSQVFSVSDAALAPIVARVGPCPVWLHGLAGCWRFGYDKKLREDGVDLGDAAACYNVAHFFDPLVPSKGPPKDGEKAVKYYTMGSERGHNVSMFSLATMYLTGTGVEESCNLALRWFMKAAEEGHPDANQAVTTILARKTRERARKKAKEKKANDDQEKEGKQEKEKEEKEKEKEKKDAGGEKVGG